MADRPTARATGLLVGWTFVVLCGCATPIEIPLTPEGGGGSNAGFLDAGVMPDAPSLGDDSDINSHRPDSIDPSPGVDGGPWNGDGSLADAGRGDDGATDALFDGLLDGPMPLDAMGDGLGDATAKDAAAGDAAPSDDALTDTGAPNG